MIIRVAAIEKLTDQTMLAKLAREATERNILVAVVTRLTDQTMLAKMSAEAEDWEVRKLAFRKLSETGLAKLAVEAEDKAVQLAVEVKQGKKTLDVAFLDSQLNTSGLGDALGAVALVGYQPSASGAVVQACHKYIRQGDVARIPELKELLTLYGNKTLAEDYMNCGQSDLDAAGKAWARANGYDVLPSFGSARVRWGSDKK